MHLRLARLKLARWRVEIGDSLVADADCEEITLLKLCSLLGRGAAAREFLNRYLAVGELLLKLLLRMGGLQYVVLGLDVGVGGHEAELLGPLKHDLVVDHAAQDLDLLDILQISRGFPHLTLGGELRLVLFFQFREGDHAVVDAGRDVDRRRLSTGSERKQGREQRPPDQPSMSHILKMYCTEPRRARVRTRPAARHSARKTAAGSLRADLRAGT
jgi:hypothetical protein